MLKLLFTGFYSLCLSLVIFCQQSDHEVDTDSLPASGIASFMEQVRNGGAPLIKGNTAWFFYEGEAERVSITGDFNNWDDRASPLSLFPGSNVWYFRDTFPPEARLDYKFVVNKEQWIQDPLNPRLIAGGGGVNSELVMPGYQFPSEIIPDSTIKWGRLETFRIQSSHMKGNRSITVYLPAQYGAKNEEKYPSVYFNDGPDYIEFGKAIHILDNFIANGEIQPLIAVFIKPDERIAEFALAEKEEYMAFVAEELVPEIDTKYRTMTDKGGRAMIGTSLGANITCYLSLDYPELFGYIGLHSPALWLNDNEGFRRVTESDVISARVISIWGSYESIAEQNRALADHFHLVAEDFRERTLPEGHSWGLWRATTDDFLKYFFPSDK